MAIMPVSCGSIPPVQDSSNEPAEIKRYEYKNPSNGRDEFVRFYQENGKLKADTYSKRWNAVINRDIQVFLFCGGGVRYDIKDLSFEESCKMLNEFDDGALIGVLDSSKGNVTSLELV